MLITFQQMQELRKQKIHSQQEYKDAVQQVQQRGGLEFFSIGYLNEETYFYISKNGSPQQQQINIRGVEEARELFDILKENFGFE